MGVGIEALFTSALGLQEPWSVEKVELDTARRRIDFELTCKANRLTCPHCQAAGQGVHDRLKAGALTGYGYTGIIVAILGQLKPWGVVAAAIVFGALVNGATFMQIKTGVPSALISAIQAILLLCYLAGWSASSLRLRRIAHAR